MAALTEVVKETLVGTTDEPDLAKEVRAAFDRHAIQDEATGEPYMTEREFVDAIAPAHEDYVSSHV
jgi:solute carrier family 25 (mitochondrial aspartate/glutamate transporter), member 12/13